MPLPDGFSDVAAGFSALMQAVRGRGGTPHNDGEQRLLIDQLRNALDRRAETLAPSDPAFIAGTFAVENLLYKGRHSRVLKLRHRDLGTAYVLKTLTTDGASSASQANLLVREARIGLDLHHPSLVGTSMLLRLADGGPGLIQPWAGYSLRERLEKEDETDLDIAQIMHDLLTALEALHNRGLVHGDVTPSNIILDPQRRIARLADFGLTIECGASWANLGLAEVGSPEYCAPEQSASSKASAAMDLYGAGRVLLRMLDTVPQGHNADLAQLADHLCKIDPGNRPETAKEALANLSRIGTRE
ncbi:protein kinase [Agrobacterium vitis]|uniref:protein kinase domain-containing protein n=1 Tax=Rhizobium/Agrobacterium group TaxID=227290 RepID=UPI0008FB4B47|nr:MULTISPECIES: protein kinase [Rhizobium/Agrobacterium group]MCF1432250.1 protein kinase [Allorhizobium ampelinum]MUO88214.1 protein kinase [Agrobacterium vitis]MUZ50657.1 protein kinase [Agrobacterium vitis]MUZ91015.1 protein kinase [Agrobacterium vitis]MVA38962.1 protein kinase [Agrobacterium vitis]